VRALPVQADRQINVLDPTLGWLEKEIRTIAEKTNDLAAALSIGFKEGNIDGFVIRFEIRVKQDDLWIKFTYCCQ